MTATSTPTRGASRGTRRRGEPAAPTFCIGDIYLAALPDLYEVEIEDVVPAAQALKIKGRGWIEQQAFAKAVKVKLGRAVYSEGLLGLKRKFIRET